MAGPRNGDGVLPLVHTRAESPRHTRGGFNDEPGGFNDSLELAILGRAAAGRAPPHSGPGYDSDHGTGPGRDRHGDSLPLVVYYDRLSRLQPGL